MRRSPRWQTWVVRLLVAGIVALAAQLGLDIAVRSFAVRSGKAAFCADVGVDRSHLSLLKRRVTLDGVHLGGPSSVAGNQLEADRCELELATRPLLFKQVVVNRGRLTGVRFTAFDESASAASGDQAGPSNVAAGWFHDDADSVARSWFTHLAERLNQDVSGQFQSVQKTESFCASWAGQSAALEARGLDLDHEATALQQRCEAAQANPLRGGTFLSGLPQKLAELQKRFKDLSSELDKLPDQLEAERRGIVAARRQDEQLAAQPTKVETAEVDAISTYLLRDPAAKPVGDLMGLLVWVRNIMPAEATKKPTGHRGEDILFAGCQDRSNILIRALEVEGTARITNRAVELRGAVSNFTTTPALLSEPMRLRLQAVGAMPAELQATVDRTHGVVRDTIVMDCQGLLLPAIRLGCPDNVTMTIAPSTGSLSVSVVADKDTLNGEIQLVQHNVHITPEAAGAFSDAAVATALEESLSHIESLATWVTISGTLAEPKCTLWSNLGTAVAEAMERAVERGSSQRARSLMVAAGKHGDEQLTVVERQMSEQQARWKSHFAAISTELQTVAAQDQPVDRLSPDRLGRRLPSNSLFR